MAVVQREIRKRGFFGKLFKFLFIAFNLIMPIWLVSYWVALSDMSTANEYEAAGAAIGGTLGSGALIFLWLAGAMILGMFVLFTRGQRVLVTEDVR